MNMLTNIIRGGQLTLHALRMFRQVSFYLLLWATFVFLIFFILSMCDKATLPMWREYLDYQIAQLMCSFVMCSKKLTVHLGRELVDWKASSVVSSGYFFTSYQYIHKYAIESFWFSIKMAGGALGLVSIFFISHSLME